VCVFEHDPKEIWLGRIGEEVQKGSALVRADTEEYEFQDARKVDIDNQCEMDVANV